MHVCPHDPSLRNERLLAPAVTLSLLRVGDDHIHVVDISVDGVIAVVGRSERHTVDRRVESHVGILESVCLTHDRVYIVKCAKTLTCQEAQRVCHKVINTVFLIEKQLHLVESRQSDLTLGHYVELVIT